jgi:hypothetical protein
VEVVFAESAFRHGYEEEDFYEALEAGPLKLRSRRGLEGVYELYGRNYVGDYLHIAYRRDGERVVVFHMRRMSEREKRFYRGNR